MPFIILGILSAGMGIHGFLISSHFIDGGVTGISMLVANVLGYRCRSWFWQSISLSLCWAIVRSAARLRSAVCWRSTGLSVCLATVHFPDVTPDKLLTAVFGGFFIGAGMGLAMRGGRYLTELTSPRLNQQEEPSLSVGDVILFLNILIFLTAEFFLGVEPALYSILTYLGDKTLDFLLHGLEEYTAITIVSDGARRYARRSPGFGARRHRLQGARRKSGADQEILLCVVTRLEIGKVLNIAQDLDDSSFITIHPLAEVKGGVLKKTAHH